MQNTRLNTIVSSLGDRVVGLFSNPWRRIALITIGLLFGFFLGGSGVTSTAGQLAYWDVPAAGCLVLVTEAINLFVYRRSPSPQTGDGGGRRLFAEILNATKMGIVYGLFLEAFKLNS